MLLRILVLALASASTAAAQTQTTSAQDARAAVPAKNSITWTFLVPQHETRDADVRKKDECDAKIMMEALNGAENIFHHHLVMQTIPLAQILTLSPPFCEMDYDAVKPPVLTPQEKAAMKEYFIRGGFIIFCKDNYPYSQDEFWGVKHDPIIEFITKELPASGPDFKFEKLTEKHPIFHQPYEVDIGDQIRHELRDNPNSVDMTLLSYRGHPCSSFYASFSWVEDGKWVTTPRPFPLNESKDPEAYAWDVNLYVFVMTH